MKSLFADFLWFRRLMGGHWEKHVLDGVPMGPAWVSVAACTAPGRGVVHVTACETW